MWNQIQVYSKAVYNIFGKRRYFWVLRLSLPKEQYLAKAWRQVYRVAICPHGSAQQAAGWVAVIAWLRQQIGQPLVWHPVEGYLSLGEAAALRAVVVYADPARALFLADQHGFVPVAAATDADGVFVVSARDGESGSLETINAAPLAVVPGIFATALGLYTLYQRGLRPQVAPAATWQQAIRRVLERQDRFGLLCEATYRAFSVRTLRLLRLVAGPWNTSAAHVWLVRRGYAQLGQQLEEALLGMHDDTAGRALLGEIGVTGWRRSMGELESVRHIVAWTRNAVRYD